MTEFLSQSMEPETAQENPKISRRLILQLMPQAAIGMVLAACGGNTETPVSRPTQTQVEASPLAERALTIDRSKRETILPYNAFGIPYAPDGHTSILQNRNGTYSTFLSGGSNSFLLIGPDLHSLRPHRVDNLGHAVPILGPDSTATYGRNYRGITSVIPGNSGELLGFFHGENHPKGQANFQASVGLAVSYDLGQTWQNHTQVLGGRSETTPGTNVTGAGQPCVIEKGDYLYTYFIDWSGKSAQPLADEIHLARVRKADAFHPDAWEKYTGRGFTRGGIHGESVPVIRSPQPTNITRYTSLPDVSYNEYLGKYLALFQTGQGFHTTASSDGINWDTPKLSFQYDNDEKSQQKGDIRYRYATLFTPGTESERTTRQSGVLLCAEDVYGQDGHHLVSFPFTLR